MGKPNLKLCKEKNRNIYQLQLLGRRQLEYYLDKIYENSTEFTRLNRKYEKYLDMKQEKKEHGNQSSRTSAE